jgi:hypothetical protein
MQNTRGDIRNAILRARAWDSNGATFDAEINTIINDALQELAEQIPDVVLPAEATVTTLPDVVSTDLSETLYGQWVIADPRSIYFTLGTSTNISGTWTPLTTNFWDGRYWIDLTHKTTGVRIRRRVRHFTVSSNVFYAVTDDGLPQDYAYDTDAGNQFTFRLYQPEVFLPADTLRIYPDAKIRSLSRYDSLTTVNAFEAARDADYQHAHDAIGTPKYVYRGAYIQMPTPRRAPTAQSDPALSPTSWSGPTATGSFKFRYTYVLGAKDSIVSVSHTGTLDPLWESAPSEASAAVTASTNALLITTNNIDAQLGFDEPGATLSDHSGLRIRIYVARTAFSGSGGDAAHFYTETAEESYVLLAEVAPTAVATGFYASYLWDGDTPDASRPLRYSPGYYSYHLYPRADQKYHIDFRVARRPSPLLHDRDVPPLQPGATEALIQKALYHACLRDGVDMGAADYHLNRYQDMVGRLRARFGDAPAPINPRSLRSTDRRMRFGPYRS